ESERRHQREDDARDRKPLELLATVLVGTPEPDDKGCGRAEHRERHRERKRGEERLGERYRNDPDWVVDGPEIVEWPLLERGDDHQCRRGDGAELDRQPPAG